MWLVLTVTFMSCEIIGSLSVSELSVMVFWSPSLFLSRFLPCCVFKHYSCFPFWHSPLMFSVFMLMSSCFGGCCPCFTLQFFLSTVSLCWLPAPVSRSPAVSTSCLILCPWTVLLFLHSFDHNISESVFVLLVLIVVTLLPLSAAAHISDD